MPRTATDLLDYLSDPATALPEPFVLDDMVTRLVILHQQSGGATFNLYFGDMAGQPFFAVSVFLEASVVESGPALSPMQVRSFIREHHRLLLDPRNNVGNGTMPQRMRPTLISRRLFQNARTPSPWPSASTRLRFTI